MQPFYNLSDPAMEDALYEIESMRRFAGLRISEAIPDETTPANEHDITAADKLLHSEEKRVWGDAGYVGIDKREERQDRDVEWLIACRPGKIKALSKKSDERMTEKMKA